MINIFDRGRSGSGLSPTFSIDLVKPKPGHELSPTYLVNFSSKQ
jgi:hypothetical protein